MSNRRDDLQGYITERPRERAVLVGVHLPLAFGGGKGGAADLPSWRAWWTRPAARSWGRWSRRGTGPEPATFVGKGKLEELKELVVATEANLVVFDNDLSPAQGRNLEKALERATCSTAPS